MVYGLRACTCVRVHGVPRRVGPGGHALAIEGETGIG